MPKRILKLFLGSVLLIASQACAPPGPPTPDPNVASTAIVQTIAALTQNPQPGIPITGLESPTPTATTALSPTPFFTFTPVTLGPQCFRADELPRGSGDGLSKGWRAAGW